MDRSKATTNSTVQELRTVFAKSQLATSLRTSQESISSLPESSGKIHVDSEESNSGDLESNVQSTFQNVTAKKPLSRPCIGPKPTVASQGSKQGIKNLVAALEGSHGMYTSKNLHGKRGAITVKDLRENSENSKLADKDSHITSTLIKKERILFCESKTQVPVTENILNEGPAAQTDCEQEVLVSKADIAKYTFLKEFEGVRGKIDIPCGTEILPGSGTEEQLRRISSSVINGDNYVCKRRISHVRRPLPSRESLGSVPPKPPKPEGMRLPLWENNRLVVNSSSSSSGETLPPPVPDRNLNVFIKPPNRVPPKPPRSSPNPSPRIPAAVIHAEPTPMSSEPLSDPEEEIYNDIIISTDTPSKVVASEDDEGDLYDDHRPDHLPPSLPKNPPPPPPVSSSQPDLHHSDPFLTASASSFNQDSSENEDPEDNIYEEAPLGPEYVNTEDVNKDKKKLKKKNLKLEQKNLEKIEKKRDKFMKMFSLSGEEIPLDAGIVKSDCKGSKYDLNVFEGETVLILRMENNPSGKWLAKNGKGKIGYVELTNIEVDVESVKSVMTVRASQIYGEEGLGIPQTEISEADDPFTC